MLRNITRSTFNSTFRRCMHSSAGEASHVSRRRLGLVLGATAVTGAYMTWRLTSESHRIRLDGPTDHIADASSDTNIGKKTKAHKLLTGAKPGSVNADLVSSTPSSSPPSTEPPSAEAFLEDRFEEAKEEAKKEAGEDSEGEAEEAGQGGAFNPVTGEINWDCPCLGGMAHGPCGLQFREAFSCFVFSEEEPKGINCVDKFKAMQDCFRDHPEIYADEIMDDDDDDDAPTAPASGDDLKEDVVRLPPSQTTVGETIPSPSEDSSTPPTQSS